MSTVVPSPFSSSSSNSTPNILGMLSPEQTSVYARAGWNPVEGGGGADYLRMPFQMCSTAVIYRHETFLDDNAGASSSSSSSSSSFELVRAATLYAREYVALPGRMRIGEVNKMRDAWREGVRRLREIPFCYVMHYKRRRGSSSVLQRVTKYWLEKRSDPKAGKPPLLKREMNVDEARNDYTLQMALSSPPCSLASEENGKIRIGLDAMIATYRVEGSGIDSVLHYERACNLPITMISVPHEIINGGFDLELHTWRLRCLDVVMHNMILAAVRFPPPSLQDPGVNVNDNTAVGMYVMKYLPGSCMLDAKEYSGLQKVMRDAQVRGFLGHGKRKPIPGKAMIHAWENPYEETRDGGAASTGSVATESSSSSSSRQGIIPWDSSDAHLAENVLRWEGPRGTPVVDVRAACKLPATRAEERLERDDRRVPGWEERQRDRDAVRKRIRESWSAHDIDMCRKFCWMPREASSAVFDSSMRIFEEKGWKRKREEEDDNGNEDKEGATGFLDEMVDPEETLHRVVKRLRAYPSVLKID